MGIIFVFLFTTILDCLAFKKLRKEEKIREVIIKSLGEVIKLQIDISHPNWEVFLKHRLNNIFKNKKWGVDKNAEVRKVNGYFKVFREVKSLRVDVKKLFSQIKNKILISKRVETEVPIIFSKKVLTFEEIRKKLGFIYLLSEYKTLYDENNKGKSWNIKLATSKIDGIILKNNQIFSFNKIVGPRDAKAGFKKADVIIKGKLVKDIGGGICQVSSTLYNAILLANLKVVERHNHSIWFPLLSYVPLGFDAAVVWKYKDFKFKNTLGFDILIEATAKNGCLYIKIWGKKPLKYKVILETEKIKKIKGRIIDGYKVISFRKIVYKDKILKIEKLPESFYIPK